MNQNEIVTQIGYRIRTADRNFITSGEITTELNRSLDRLSAIVDISESVKTTTISYTGDGSYTGPTDLKKPISLYDRTNNIGYKRVSEDERIDAEDTGLYLYSIVNGTLKIEGDGNSTTLTLVYYSTYDSQTSGGTLQKGLSTGTDLPLISARFHDYYVEDVSMILFRKARKYDDYKIARDERQLVLSKIFDEYPTREEQVVELIGGYTESYN